MSYTTRTVPRLLMRVWDAPTRLFHWGIVLLVAFSYACAELGWVRLHSLSGYTILALVLFRVAWGFVGSETSRFANFLRGPVEVSRHLAAFGRREPDTEIGHNAAGGWLVLAMIAALLFQAGTGLFSGAGGDGQGPLAKHVGEATGDWLTGWHHRGWWLLLALVGLHVLLVLAYAAVKRHDLVRPMVTGKKRLPANMRQPRFASPLLALAIVAVSAGLVWALVQFG